jgi:hypothetical protein
MGIPVIAYQDVYAQALLDTKSFFGANYQTVAFVIFTFVGLVVHYKFIDKKTVIDEIKFYLTLFVLPVSLLFAFNLFMAPYKTLKSKETEWLVAERRLAIIEDETNKEKEVVKTLINIAIVDINDNVSHCKAFKEFAQKKDSDIIAMLNDNPLPESPEIDDLLSNIYFRNNYSMALYALMNSQKTIKKLLAKSIKPNISKNISGSVVLGYCSYSQFVKAQLITTLQLVNDEIDEDELIEFHNKSLQALYENIAVKVN